MCVHTYYVYTHTSPTRTQAEVHTYTHTPAVQALARGQVWNGVTIRLTRGQTRGQTLRRHPTTDNWTTATEDTNGCGVGTATGRGTG